MLNAIQGFQNQGRYVRAEGDGGLTDDSLDLTSIQIPEEAKISKEYSLAGADHANPGDYFPTMPKYNPDVFANNRAAQGVTVGDVHHAIMNLPELMSAVANYVEGAPDREWALSVISPFHAASKGARIPSYSPVQTVTGTNFQDYDFSVSGYSCLVVNNFTAYNLEPWVIINNMTQ